MGKRNRDDKKEVTAQSSAATSSSTPKSPKGTPASKSAAKPAAAAAKAEKIEKAPKKEAEEQPSLTADDSAVPVLPTVAGQKFKEGELVRCLDNGMLYESKVLRVGNDSNYFIHYQGWAKRYEKWVHSSLIMPEGPAAEKYAVQLKELQKKRKETRETAKRGRDPASEDQRKKARVDEGRGLLAHDPEDHELKVPLPFTLKKALVEDWERLTQVDPPLLVALPRSPCVHDVVQLYLENKAKRSSAAGQLKIVELFEGLVLYFDHALPVVLLYRTERRQYSDLVAKHPGVQPSKLYGCEHLLRLFTKLPSVLGQVPMSTVESSQLQTNLTDFLVFVQRNSTSLLSTPYEERAMLLPDDPTPAPQTARADGVGESGGGEEATASSSSSS